MEILNQVGNILLQALPTFFLVVLLYVYLRKVFFGPMAKVLQDRSDITEGARRRAEEALRAAEQTTAEYESALQAARVEIFRAQEAERKKAADAHAARLQEARGRAEAQLRQARERIAADVAAAKNSLASESDALADRIIHIVLERGASA